MRREEVKLSLLTDIMTLYAEHPKDNTHTHTHKPSRVPVVHAYNPSYLGG
jgi:hypothetical protein